MDLIEAEEELFGLNGAAEVINLSGSEAEEQYDDDDDDAGDGRHSHPEGEGAENEEVPDANSAKIVKPKRVIKNPQPKLDVARLCGPRGIGIVQKCLSSAPYRGKGYEAEDLALLLQRLQHWAHRLYPRLPFNDTIAQIEKLGNKKALQVNVKRLRMDMYETPVEGDAEVKDDAIDVGDAEAAADAHDDEPDVFDELLRQSGAPSMSLHDRGTNLAADGTTGVSVISSQPTPAVSVVLTEEQKTRMERNKQLALERRRARLAETNTVPTLNDAAAGVKRRRSDGADSDDDDDDRPVPTQAELRELREGLLINVMSQSSAGTACEVTGRDPVFDGDFDDADMDAFLAVLNKVEGNDAVSNKSVCFSRKSANNSAGNNVNEDQLNRSVADELSRGEDVNDYECETFHNSEDRRQNMTAESLDLCAEGALSVTTEPLSSSHNANDIANAPDAVSDISTTRQSSSGLDVTSKTVAGATVNDESLDATSKTVSNSVISDEGLSTKATEASLTVSVTDALVKDLSAGESDLTPTCSSDPEDNAATAATCEQESDGTSSVARVCDDRDAEDGLSDMQVEEGDERVCGRNVDQEVNKRDVADQVVDDKTTDEQDVSR